MIEAVNIHKSIRIDLPNLCPWPLTSGKYDFKTSVVTINARNTHEKQSFDLVNQRSARRTKEFLLVLKFPKILMLFNIALFPQCRLYIYE